MAYRVVVDYNLCETNGRCEKLAPEVFRVDDDEDKMYIVNETPGDEHLETVKEAVRLCPKQALRLQEEG